MGPATLATPPKAMSAGIVSPLGEELHRFPPRVARPWIWIPPIRKAASTRPG